MGVVSWKRRKRVICFGYDMLIWAICLVLGKLVGLHFASSWLL